MSAVLFYLPFSVAAKPTNIGAPGAKAYFYVPSSTTLRPVYSTSGLTTQLSNPVVADGLGRFPAIYLNNALSYKLVIKDKGGTTLFTADPYVPGTAPDASALSPYQAAAEAAAAAAEASASEAADAIEDAVAETLSTVQGYVASAAASALAAEAVFEGTEGVVALPRFTPEMFDAEGGNASVDAAALHAMGVALSAAGAGVIDFYPGREYLVGGGQVLSSGHQASGYSFPPIIQNILDINGCTGPVVVNMNGATIKCASGGKYGLFLDNGSPQVVLTGGGYATPYYAMIRVYNCSGPVYIGHGELDGNISATSIGAGDHQIAYTGLDISDNTGGVVLEGIHSHHHGEDGGGGNGLGVPDAFENCTVRNCVFENNGRQGWSQVGGVGWLFENCRFNGSGKDLGTMTYSAPGAGFDLEPEGGRYVLDIAFKNCEFADNTGPGCLAPEDVAANGGRYRFDNCKFVGTTSWATWLNHPNITLRDCVIVGASTRMHANLDPAKAIQYYNCLFTDDAAQSPTGVVYNEGASDAFLNFGGGVPNIYFEECTFERHSTLSAGNIVVGGFPNGVQTPWFHNCLFKRLNATGHGLAAYGYFSGPKTSFYNCVTIPDSVQAAAWAINDGGYAYDTYLWEDSGIITGGAKAQARYNATASRETFKRVYIASATWNPASVANGAQTTTTMTVTGVALGDSVEDVSFSLDLQGLALRGYVSAANTVTLALSNATGGAVDLASGTVRVKVRAA